jgi:hypothetical protein
MAMRITPYDIVFRLDGPGSRMYRLPRFSVA